MSQIRQDYLLRLANRIGLAFKKVLGWRGAAEANIAMQELRRAFSEVAGFDLNLAEMLSTKDLKVLLSTAGEPDQVKFFLAAVLLGESAERQPARATALREKARELLMDVHDFKGFDRLELEVRESALRLCRALADERLAPLRRALGETG